MPKMNRPFEMLSTVAASLASQNGSRWATSVMPVPSMMFLVTAAAAPSDTNWSWERQYSSGNGGAPSRPPHGVSRLVGMWLCSGNHSDSKPRSSAALANSTGPMALSVGNIITPIFTSVLLVDEGALARVACHGRRRE